MKTLLYVVMTTFIVASLSSCRSYDYYTAGLNKTNMSQYRSFAWLPPAGKDTTKATLVGAVDVKIKDAAVASLAAKGLKLQQNEPDLLVTYTAKVGRGTKNVYYSPYYGYGGYGYGGWYGGFGYGGWGWGGGFGYGWGGWYRPYYYGYGGAFPYYGGIVAVDKEHYKEGTVIIDLIDTHTKRVVWRGFGVGEVRNNTQKNIDDLPKVVDGIISQLQLAPPPAVKKS